MENFLVLNVPFEFACHAYMCERMSLFFSGSNIHL